MFFNKKIGYDVNDSTVGFHAFECLLFLYPVVGAIIADSWWGRYKTMVIMSVLVAIGLLVISVGVVDVFKLPIV